MHKTNEPPILEVHDLVVAYRHKPVLWNVDLTFPRGKLIGILGPNGAGKSTLLKAILGMVPSNSGWVKFWGETFDLHRKRVSYVPQRESVDWDFPISVKEVVMMGRYPHMGFWKRPKAADKARVDEALAQVGLSSFADRQISALSGGQQQRVFLARALAQEADLYIMDEPLSALDATTEQTILEVFTQMTNAGKTIIVVHHDLQTTQAYFEWLVLLNMCVVAAGPTKKILTQELLQKAYGNHPTLLVKAGNLLEEKKIKPRTHY
ncbi:MAG: metal ABC transporter ATP-binding protein [Bacteroidota bacterium]